MVKPTEKTRNGRIISRKVQII